MSDNKYPLTKSLLTASFPVVGGVIIGAGLAEYHSGTMLFGQGLNLNQQMLKTRGVKIMTLGTGILFANALALDYLRNED